eukprot:362860-Chlamydomonas_euryale.AAC.19
MHAASSHSLSVRGLWHRLIPPGVAWTDPTQISSEGSLHSILSNPEGVGCSHHERRVHPVLTHPGVPLFNPQLQTTVLYLSPPCPPPSRYQLSNS